MKILKYAAFLLGGVAALLTLAILVLTLSFDAARIKAELIRLVQAQTQRTLVIDGTPELSFWPSLGLRLGAARLSERGSDADFASLARARVSLAVMPLLRRQVVIDELDIEGLSIDVVRGKDGRFNFDDLLAQEDEAEPAGLTLDIAGIRLSGARLSYLDAAAGRRLAISELALATGRLGDTAEGRLSLAARLAADAPEAALAIELETSYRLDVAGRRYGLADLALNVAGDALGLAGLSASLAARTLAFDAAAGTAAAEALRVDARLRRDGADIALAAEAPRLALGSGQASAVTLSGSLRLTASERTLTANLALGEVTASAAALEIGSARLDLDGREGETALKASFATPVKALPAERRVEAPKLAGELAVSHPRLARPLVLPFTASLRADFAKSSAAGELAATLDDSTLRATFGATRLEPLALGFSVDLDRLDLDRYLAPPRDGAAAGDAPVDFSALAGLDLKGSVRIGALQFAKVKAADVRFEVRAANGRLDLNPVSAQLYEGRLAGAVSAEAAGNRLRLRQSLSGVALSPLLRDALERQPIEGRGDVAVDLVTEGATVAAMKKRLAGSARVQLRDGAIRGLDITRSLAEWSRRVAGRGDAQATDAGARTAFTELSASFRIAEGVARNDDLAAKSPFLRLAGAGDIDIGAGRLNYLARASVVASAAGQGGKELATLRGVTVPVRLSGPFDQLSYRLEAGEMLGEAVKARAAEQVGEATRQIKEKAAGKLLEGGLKGLWR